MANWRVLLGISIFWLALSVLFDGLNSLVLPKLLLERDGSTSATTLGLMPLPGSWPVCWCSP